MSSIADLMLHKIDQISFDRGETHYGQVCRFDGQFVECDGFPAPIGSVCEIETLTGQTAMAKLLALTMAEICWLCWTMTQRFALGPPLN